jgi:hypothetical protein
MRTSSVTLRLAIRRFPGLALALSAAACATAGTGGGAGGAPAPSASRAAAQQWPVKTREHVDLWLHGFALLQTDTNAVVPLFKRGYATEMTVLKNRANVLTQLDANRDRLQSELAGSRLLVNAQFVPFYFSSLDEMRSVIDRFVATSGNPQGARSQQEAAQFAVLASYFQSASERAWLSLFASSLWDEDAKFYHSYWTRQQAERGPVIDSVQAMWQHTVRPALSRFLTNTQQRDGDLLLSLPLGGEGRTIGGSAVSRTTVAVDFPERQGDAPEAIYTLVHELVGSIANAAITDNTTPAEQRNGTADRITSAAQVRGGLMLLEKQLPALADGYARFYIAQTGHTPTSSPRAQLVSLFPIPDTIRDAMSRQIDLVQGGI